MKNIFLIAFVLICAIPATAQDFDKAKMDSLFSLIEKNKAGMGSVSIFKNGKEVYKNSMGFANVETGQKANAGTKYRIGSISKMFTAVLVMQLVEAGKLSLDTKLAKFYPEMPNAEKISIEHLLRHQSGLFNFTNSPSYSAYMESPKTRTELLEIFKENGSIFEPGEKSEYSNTNYVLLSFIIEDVADKDFAGVLEERIAKPLNLKSTYFGGKIKPEENEALSYQKLSGWDLASETDMSIPQGAGAIVSTPTDVNTFLSGLFGGKLVSESTLEKMKQIENGFGIGMSQIPFYDKIAYGHNGGIDGFVSTAGYFPDGEVSFAYFSNGVEMGLNDIAIGVLSIYFGKEYELPSFVPEYQVEPKVLQDYIGVYSSPDFPLKITISTEGNTLLAQATGQSQFALEAYGKDKFKFDAAGLKMEFVPEEDKMIFEQGGMTFELTREKN